MQRLRLVAWAVAATAATAALGGCASGPTPNLAVAELPQAPGPTGTAATKRLRVIGTNDFHGNLRSTPDLGGREVGGAAVLAAWFDSVRAQTDAPTLLLDGGDVMQGTP